MQSDGEMETERNRVMEAAYRSRTGLMDTINKMEWITSYDKNGVKSWVAPVAEQEREFRAMGTTTVHRPPSVVHDFIMDTKARASWDKILNEHKIVEEFSKDENHRTLLWTMKFRPRYLKMKRRVSVFACYTGVHPVASVGGYMVSMASINTPLAPILEDEIAFDTPISGYIMSPAPNDPNSTILTYVLRVTIQIQHLGFMERSIMRSISQWGPPHMITDRMSKLRSLIEEKAIVSVVATFPHTRESNFPPSFLTDFEYVKTDPIENRDALINYYCGEEKNHLWTHVTSERGLVMQKFTGPLLHERHNLALKLSFTTLNFIQFSRCLSESDKRLIWEPCATKVEHIWDDGPMNICLKVVGGGPAKGRGCPKFEVFIYHIYSYGLKGDSDAVDACVYEEHSDGNLLLVMLTANSPSSNIDVLFFTNTAQYSDRSRTSLTFLPASPLAPIDRTLLESVIEFRNVVELDTWLPTESFEKLSLSDVSKSATGQGRRSIELATKAPPPAISTQKRKPSPENDPIFGKVRNYFNKLPSFSSMFSFHTQQPIPPRSKPSLHLLFSKKPNADVETDYLINNLPYELLVHILKYVNLEDIRSCSQISHRAWQVTNTDIVWRDQMEQIQAQEHNRDGWEKYAPVPHFSSPETPPRSWSTSDSPFEKPVWLRIGEGRSRPNGTDIDMLREEPPVEHEQRRHELKSLLDSVQGYASPFKWEYLRGVAAEKCWRYGVSNYVACGAMVGDPSLVMSEEEKDDIILVGNGRGEVKGVSPADLDTPSTRVLFSFQPSQQAIVQSGWCGDKVLMLHGNGEMVECNRSTGELKLRRNFAPMTGAYLFKNDSTSLLASYVGDKMRVWNADDGSKMLKFRSSRGVITNVRLNANKCVAVTAMHALYTVNMIDMPTGNLQTCLSGHQGEITGVRLLDSDANIVASAARDGTVRVWDLRAGIQIAKQYSHPAGVEVTSFSSTPDKLVAGLSTGVVAYWDPRYSNKPVANFALPSTSQHSNMHITNVQITNDNKRLIATWDSGLFSTWILYPR